MVKIEDGKGKGTSASVNSVNRLDVSSRSSSRDFYISRDNGQVYTITSEDAATAANEETIYLQNTSSTKNLFIDSIILASDAEVRFRLKFVTGTAAGSTLLTAINLNKTSSNAAAVIARGDGAITGLTDDGDIALVTVGAGDTGGMSLEDALILGQNDAVAIESEAIGDVAITIEFHLE